MTCDLCHKDLSGHYYVDGRVTIPGRTIWGYACIDCWNNHGVSKFGLGYARLYNPKHEPIPHKLANDPNFRKSIGLRNE